jgi:hypothetical protein
MMQYENKVLSPFEGTDARALGVIAILDRDALVQSSNGPYAPPDSDLNC